VSVLVLGRPRGLSGARLKDTEEAAARMTASERSRNRSELEDMEVDSVADPGEEDMDMTSSEQLAIWKLLPHLQNLPEAMLRKLPLTAMFQLNSA